MLSKPIKTDPELLELLKRSKEYVDSLTEDQKKEMLRIQAESYVRSCVSGDIKYKYVDGVKVYESYEDYCWD